MSHAQMNLVWHNHWHNNVVLFELNTTFQESLILRRSLILTNIINMNARLLVTEVNYLTDECCQCQCFFVFSGKTLRWTSVGPGGGQWNRWGLLLTGVDVIPSTLSTKKPRISSCATSRPLLVSNICYTRYHSKALIIKQKLYGIIPALLSLGNTVKA